MLHIAKKRKTFLSMLAVVASVPALAADLPDGVNDWMQRNDFKVLVALDVNGVATLYEHRVTQPITGKTSGLHDKCPPSPKIDCTPSGQNTVSSITYQIAPGNVNTASLGIPSLISPAYAGMNCYFINMGGALYKICY